MTNNNIYDLPKTATISYYDVESDKNLTVEEWNSLQQNNSNEITIINKSGSNFRSEKEGYGPTTYGKVTTHIWNGKEYETVAVGWNCNFCLIIECSNWAGGGGKIRVYNTSDALDHARQLENGYYSQVSSEVERKCATLIREAVQKYNENSRMLGFIRVKGNFWGGYEWSYKC